MVNHQDLTLKEVFDKLFEDVKFDKRLVDKIYRYQVGYLNKNEETLSFFGSNLIGVHLVSFRESEVVKFFQEVLDMDYIQVTREFREVTTIVHEFEISGDVFNHVLMYIIHRCMTSTQMGKKDQYRGAFDAALIFYIRTLTVLQSRYFQFPADPKIAQAAYADLTHKSLIKRLGSWIAVVNYRADKLVMAKGLWFDQLIAYLDDQKTVEMINDCYGRIKKLYIGYNEVFYKKHSEGARIGISSSTVIDNEGVEHIKEKVKSVERYVTYLLGIVPDKPSFIRQDIMDVIVGINTNTSNRILTHTLGWLSDNYKDQKWHKLIDEFISLVIVHSFHLLQEQGSSKIKDYPSMLINLKNLYLSTRSTDPELIKIRDIGEKLMKAANGRINKSLMMATRTSTILYITLRALVVHNGK